MGKISFDVNNGGKLDVFQKKHDGSINVSTGENNGYNISAGDFVMLLNFINMSKITTCKMIL